MDDPILPQTATPVVTMPSTVPGGTVVSPDLEAALTKAVSTVPFDKKGAVTANVSNAGVEISGSWRVRQNLTATGYAGRLWGGRGWQAGARAQWVF